MGFSSVCNSTLYSRLHFVLDSLNSFLKFWFHHLCPPMYNFYPHKYQGEENYQQSKDYQWVFSGELGTTFGIWFGQKKNSISGMVSDGTYESCYAFWPFKNCWILIFFEGWLRAFWIDFRSEGTRRSVNLSTFLLRSLKVERCDFLWKNCSGALEPYKTWIPPLSFYY